MAKEESRDYDKYAYFRSKAKNYAVSIKPFKEKMVDGIKEVTEGLRVEFMNGMLRVNKSKENEHIIAFLRDKIAREKEGDPKRRQIFEDEKPLSIIEKENAEKKIAEQEAEIERLRKQNEDTEKKLKEEKEKQAASAQNKK